MARFVRVPPTGDQFSHLHINGLGGPRMASLEMVELECERRTISGSRYRTVQSRAKTEASSHRASVRDINRPMGEAWQRVAFTAQGYRYLARIYTADGFFAISFSFFLLCVSGGRPFYLDNVQAPRTLLTLVFSHS